MTLAVLIPAFEPDATLTRIARELAGFPDVRRIIVVNDGSCARCETIFKDLESVETVEVLRHESNQGKGAALRTGLARFVGACPEGEVLVTADADGQHLPSDIVAVGREAKRTPDALVLGSRAFGRETPLRSRFGNVMTRHVLRWTVGCRLGDTQTGLRAIPLGLIPHLLQVQSPRYEFELEMLLVAHDHGFEIREVPVQTVYEPGNPTSHFDPLMDSARIYRSLLRHKLAARASRSGPARV